MSLLPGLHFSVLIPSFIGVVVTLLWWRMFIVKRAGQEIPLSPSLEKAGVERVPLLSQTAQIIEPLTGFNWEETEPLKFRPFKPVYHITMALQASTPSDLIVIDRNYRSRVLERRELMKSNPSQSHGLLDTGHGAVAELYSYMLGTYLPSRYPTMFVANSLRGTFTNFVTGVEVPLNCPEDKLEALRIIGETIEDDCFLLHQTDEGHMAVAFVCCFPTGFDPSAKIGKVLRDIHEPVPGYDKIGASMERFFGRLEVGKTVKRLNWAVTTQPDLFNSKGNHIHEGDDVSENQDVDMDKAALRVEFQALSRLPKTKAILFSFKTYLYPIREVKDEGLGIDLADAIEGFKTGNAPGMWVYKGPIRWGKSVCEFLRS